jgi:hypothetical protein
MRGQKQFAAPNEDPEAWRTLIKSGVSPLSFWPAPNRPWSPQILKACYSEIPLGCIATNGFKRIPDTIGYKIHISVWGNDETRRRIRKAKDLLTKQLDNYRDDPRAIFVYTFTQDNIDEAYEVMDSIAGQDGRMTFNVFSPPVGYEDNLRHDASSLDRTSRVMVDLMNKYPQHVVRSYYNAVAHSHGLGLHELYGCTYPRMNPSKDIGLGWSFRQYRADLSWDREVACCVPDKDCDDCRHYASGSAVVTARLYRHVTDPDTFRVWLDYVDTYLAVWVTGYEKGENLCRK